jgi:hypothetical protein
MRLPLRTTFDRPDEWPIAVSITLDDEPADRVVLADAAWNERVIRLPPPGSRRVRRVDIRSDRARDDNHAVRWGESRSALRGESAYTDTNAASDALNSTG